MKPKNLVYQQKNKMPKEIFYMGIGLIISSILNGYFEVKPSFIFLISLIAISLGLYIG